MICQVWWAAAHQRPRPARGPCATSGSGSPPSTSSDASPSSYAVSGCMNAASTLEKVPLTITSSVSAAPCTALSRAAADPNTVRSDFSVEFLRPTSTFDSSANASVKSSYAVCSVSSVMLSSPCSHKKKKQRRGVPRVYIPPSPPPPPMRLM